MYVMYLQENVVVNMLSYMYMHMSARRMKGGGEQLQGLSQIAHFSVHRRHERYFV